MIDSTSASDTRFVVHAAAMSTNIELAAARADLHRAAAAADPHGRTQYALSARDNAASVLLEPSCTPLERDYAELYFA
jgi:hypothetical protein